MKLHLRLVVLLTFGMIPGEALFAAPSDNAKAAGRYWAEQWLGNVRTKYNPTQKVNLSSGEGHFDYEIQTGKSSYQKPLITGPVALLLNLSAAISKPPKDPNEFGYWIKYTANDAMRSRYQKIMQDLVGYHQSLGYSLSSAHREAAILFHSKRSIYYPLVYGGSPDFSGLEPHQTRNPYGSSTLANSAADNYNLGLLCQKVGNFTQAAQLYQQAALTGHASAQASLAYLLETGTGVSRNAEKALEFYTRAARQGHAVAQYNLGRIFQNGLSDGIKEISPDAEQAEYYLQRAAAHGIISAHHQLGMLYYNFGLQIAANSLNNDDLKSWDTNKDNVISPQENRYLRDAHDHFLLAAQKDYGPALHALGVMYFQGQGVQNNPEKAVYWLEKAAAFPQPDSYYNLAQLYETGRGTEINLSRAFMLYQQAARMGHAPSQYNIGLFYYQGRRAGSLISVKVTKEFANQHNGKQIIDGMVSRNPQQNAILAQASALYRPSDPNSPMRTLDIYVDEENVQFVIQVLFELLPKETLNLKPAITPLGEDNPVQASAWWMLAAAQKQPAAQQALALANNVLTPEQAHVARAIASTERTRMSLPPPQTPTGKQPRIQADSVVDWGTGFFVSRDGYVIAGKHLLLSGNKFEIITENGTFPAQVVPVKGDLSHYLLLKIQGNYDFPALSLTSSHSTRLKDPVQTIGYQMPSPNSSGHPRPAQAETRIRGVLGAQADPRFFSLTDPVLGDQLLLQFEKYMDDDRTPNAAFEDTPDSNAELAALQSLTRDRLRGVLRAAHILLGSADMSVGYELKKDSWYDSIHHQWLKEADKQSRAHRFPAGSWITLEHPEIESPPPIANVRNNQALIRLSIIPGMIANGAEVQRFHQLTESILTKPIPGNRLETELEKFVLDAKFSVIGRINGFRGAALMNGQGQAIGLFFPSNQTRSPDVFQNFSSYHRYMLKSDQLLAFLNRAPKVEYEIQKPEIPTLVSTGPASLKSDAYLLAKAQASMVLVQVSGASVAATSKGGTK